MPTDFTSIGDMARLDDEGFVYLAGRRDDVINTGGIKVHPEKIEAVLLAIRRSATWWFSAWPIGSGVRRCTLWWSRWTQPRRRISRASAASLHRPTYCGGTPQKPDDPAASAA